MQVTLHTHTAQSVVCRGNSSLTVESNVDPFYQVVPNTVFDDSARNVCVVYTSSAEHMKIKKGNINPHAANASHRMICNEVTAVLKELSPTV